MMKALLLVLGLVSLASAKWIGEEYWTTIGSDGRPLHGSVSDFARIDGFEDRFIAFWITRKYYPGEHFEAFGQAYLNADGLVCATFAGFRLENIEICGEFRVLSVPPHYAGRNIFEWVDGRTAPHETVGYLAHRIAKASTNEGEIVYGDAIPAKYSFAGALRTQTDIEKIDQGEYVQRVQLLRLLVAENIHVQPVIPRIPPPPPVQPVRVVELMCDASGRAYEKKVTSEGHFYYAEYDVQANGGRRPNCPQGTVIHHQVDSRPDRYAHAILPDHHDANGEIIGDANIGRRYRRKILRGARRQQLA